MTLILQYSLGIVVVGNILLFIGLWYLVTNVSKGNRQIKERDLDNG